MAAFTADGDAFKVERSSFRQLPDRRGGGGLRPTVNGQLRGRSDWVKRGWGATLLALDAAELADIQAMADPDVDRTLAGDLFPSSAVCRVQITGEIAYIPIENGTDFVWSVPITALEV